MFEFVSGCIADGDFDRFEIELTDAAPDEIGELGAALAAAYRRQIRARR